MTNPSTFRLFSSLPQELRNQIWYDALPDKVGSVLHFCRKGCWCPRHLLSTDEGYDAENDENNLNFEFRHDLLDDVQFDVPLICINREIRQIVLAWIREQGIKIRPHEDRQHLYPVFLRPFDPMHDALYVALDKWDDFLREPVDRTFEADLFEKLIDLGPDLQCIAVPEALLRNEEVVATLSEMFQCFFRLKVLLIVVDPQPDPQSMWWKFESTQRGAFFWNNNRGGFDFVDNKCPGDDSLYRLIEEAGKKLSEGFALNEIHNFEIRPVFAVKR